MKKNFLFMLTDKVDATEKERKHIYEAEQTEEGSWLIGWFEYGIKKTIYYSDKDVADYLSNGSWTMIAESEIENIINGKY